MHTPDFTRRCALGKAGDAGVGRNRLAVKHPPSVIIYFIYMPELADIVKLHKAEYLTKYGAQVPENHRKALWQIENCRTETLGGHIERCSNSCGYERYRYNSCQSRSCPKCNGIHTARWVKKKQDSLLPVQYFHLVFTLPSCLRDIVRAHQKIAYSILLRSAAEAVIILAKDPKYVGGLIGVIAILHTWSRTMFFHPHAHLLIPGGGINTEGGWNQSHKKYLIPYQPAATIFRALFIKRLKKALPEVTIPDAVWNKEWVVDVRATAPNPMIAVKYLSNYINRIAITNRRILACNDDVVKISYKRNKDIQWCTMKLKPEEFLRRYLEHVLPKGFVRIRYYGIFTSANKKLFRQVRSDLLTIFEKSDNVSKPDIIDITHLFHEIHTCPQCLTGYLVIVAEVPKRRQTVYEPP